MGAGGVAEEFEETAIAGGEDAPVEGGGGGTEGGAERAARPGGEHRPDRAVGATWRIPGEPASSRGEAPGEGLEGDTGRNGDRLR